MQFSAWGAPPSPLPTLPQSLPPSNQSQPPPTMTATAATAIEDRKYMVGSSNSPRFHPVAASSPQPPNRPYTAEVSSSNMGNMGDSKNNLSSTLGGTNNILNSKLQNNPSTDFKKNKAPLVAKGAWGKDGNEEEGNDGKRRSVQPLKLKFPSKNSKNDSVNNNDIEMDGYKADNTDTTSLRSRVNRSEYDDDGNNINDNNNNTDGNTTRRSSMVTTTTTIGNNRIESNNFLMSTGEDMINGFILPRGRLSIKCLDGTELRRNNSMIKRIDPYLKFRVGKTENHVNKMTKVIKRAESNVSFEEEMIIFDILDPLSYVFERDVLLVIEVWNKVGSYIYICACVYSYICLKISVYLCIFYCL